MDTRKTASPITLTRLLALSSSDPEEQSWRLGLVERDLGLLVKAIFLAILFQFLYWSNWVADLPVNPNVALDNVTWRYAQQVVQYLFLVYVAANFGFAFVLLGLQQVPFAMVQWTAFTMALVDALFLGALIVVTGGVESALYWLYFALILRNSLSVSPTVPQFILNLLTCGAYLGAVVLEQGVRRMDAVPLGQAADVTLIDRASLTQLGWPFLVRVGLLPAVAIWCWMLQVLVERQRRREDELHELAWRRQQLEASGRLAAEIAHQLKNPLAIINNASYTLQRTVKEGKTITQQIQIIREEVERSDRLITELMGYAQLAEGRVDRLDVREVMERALNQVFPTAVKYDIEIQRDYAEDLPLLLAQPQHITETFVNLLQNAREIMEGRGTIRVTAASGPDYSIVITIEDSGPGIAPEIRDQIFEPYFSTREKGTGLGLAIVKHNVQMYGGRVDVESELGKGARFILTFPARTLMRLRK